MLMQINKNKPSHRKIKIILAIVLAIALVSGAILYFYLRNSSQNSPTSANPDKINSVDYDKATKEQRDAGEAAKKAAIESEEGKNTTDPMASDGAPAISISSVGQDGGILSIRTMINSVATGGTCRLELARVNSQTVVVREASTRLLGSYSVCEGFDVSTGDLEKGDWKISVTYQENDVTSKDEKTVGIV